MSTFLLISNLTGLLFSLTAIAMVVYGRGK